MKPRIVVLGSSNTDMIVGVPRVPRAGETILGGEFATAAGGKGANQAVAAARAGGAVSLVACVGRDALGDAALAGFRREGIDVRHVARDRRAPSGVALILVARGGENCIAVAPGANRLLSPRRARAARAALVGSSALLVQLETPLETVASAAATAARAGVPVILNPAPACALPASLLRLVTILTPNQTEAELLSGVAVHDTSSAAEAATRLLAAGVRSVVITMGARGAFAMSSQGRWRVPGFRVKAVDTTGAGDVFNGSLAVALGEGRLLPAAVRFANAAAALSVTRRGAQPSAPTRVEIDELLRSGG